MTNNATPGAPGDINPPHVFLTAKETIVRYGWARIYGYLMLKSTGFPRRIGDRFRLDTLIPWEQAVLAGELPGCPDQPECRDDTPPTVTGPEREPTPPASSAPPEDDVPAAAPTRRRTRGPRRASTRRRTKSAGWPANRAAGRCGLRSGGGTLVPACWIAGTRGGSHGDRRQARRGVRPRGGCLAAPCEPVERLHAHPRPAAAGRRDLDPQPDRLAVTRPGRPGVRVDGDQPQGVPATALTGPLGVQGCAGRDRLGEAEGGPGPFTAPGRAERARCRQRTGRAVHRAGRRREERVDDPLRARGADGREALVHRPDGRPVRRRHPCGCRRREPVTGRTDGERARASHAPALTLPRTRGGHAVGIDRRVDTAHGPRRRGLVRGPAFRQLATEFLGIGCPPLHQHPFR